MTDAITISKPRNRDGSTGHVLAKRSVTFTEIRNKAVIRQLRLLIKTETGYVDLVARLNGNRHREAIRNSYAGQRQALALCDLHTASLRSQVRRLRSQDSVLAVPNTA